VDFRILLLLLGEALFNGAPRRVRKNQSFPEACARGIGKAGGSGRALEKFGKLRGVNWKVWKREGSLNPRTRALAEALRNRGWARRFYRQRQGAKAFRETTARRGHPELHLQQKQALDAILKGFGSFNPICSRVTGSERRGLFAGIRGYQKGHSTCVIRNRSHTQTLDGSHSLRGKSCPSSTVACPGGEGPQWSAWRRGGQGGGGRRSALFAPAQLGLMWWMRNTSLL